MIHVQKVHIVGIGGVGASAMAKWYLLRGAEVSGSDASENDFTKELQDLGAEIHKGHDATYLPEDCELLLYSPAVPESNPERTKAAEKKVPQLAYPEFLGELAKEHKTIAISGTNGKSTTTAMVAKILIDAGFDPVVFLGTKSADLSHGNFNDGKGVWMVVEACEYREHMQHIKPHIAAITNIEADHLDYYKDVAGIRRAFQKWVDQIQPFEGFVVLNEGEKGVEHEVTHDDVVYFGAEHTRADHGIQSFSAKTEDHMGAHKTAMQIRLPGKFNTENAAAAFTISRLVHIPEAQAKKSITEFKGTWRRFEYIGGWQGAEIYSDYAHHPTAIAGTIKGAKEFYPNNRLVVLFEPHQHARTKELFNDFVDAFQGTDLLILNEIYRVEGRTETDEVSSEQLVAAIKEKYPNQEIEYTPSHQEARSALERHVKEGDIVIIMGAGTIDEVARAL